jgi:protein-S-isoprenylcysteine O-methyltransferase Ste14
MAQQRKFWMRWRVRTGYPVGVIYLILARPTPKSILIGAAIAAVGLLLRGAASGHLSKDKVLAVTGLYAHTRNPLYLGSAFLALGFAVAGRSWIGGALIAMYFGVFYYAVMRNEEEDLRVRFGPPFERYARLVPLFFPRAVNPANLADLRDAKDEGKFSWAQFNRNREYQAAIGTILGLVAMVAIFYARQHYGH